MQALKAQADQSLASLESTLPQNESQTDAEPIVAERETKGKVLSPSLISSQHVLSGSHNIIFFLYKKSYIKGHFGQTFFLFYSVIYKTVSACVSLCYKPI